MAIPVDQSSSSSSSEHDQSNETNADYQRISHYELIPSHNSIPHSNENELNNDSSDSQQSQNGASHTATISYNGVEVYVFGDVDGLTTSFQTLNGFSNGNTEMDTDGEEEEEEEEEERKREEAEAAVREANRVDMERRNAPLNPETRSAVINAMRGISLQGFRPDWADAIPEHQWVDHLRRSREVPRQS